MRERSRRDLIQGRGREAGVLIALNLYCIVRPVVFEFARLKALIPGCCITVLQALDMYSSSSDTHLYC